MSNISLRNISLLALFASLSALGMALISQYGFGLHPCHLCYWQRLPYACAALFAFTAFLKPRYGKALLWLCVIAFMIDAAIAAYHAGIEWHWWQGLESCSGNMSGNMSIDEIRAKIMGAATISCSEAAFRFMGLSMAGWNAIYAILCALLVGLSIRRAKS